MDVRCVLIVPGWHTLISLPKAPVINSVIRLTGADGRELYATVAERKEDEQLYPVYVLRTNLSDEDLADFCATNGWNRDTRQRTETMVRS